jgi:hypothetical protein
MKVFDMNNIEEWKDIPFLKGIYQASSSGMIRSIDRMCVFNGKMSVRKGIILKQSTTRNGYKRVLLSINGKKKNALVHRLVLMAFNPNDQEHSLTVNHRDGLKSNNFLANLEWCTQKENKAHAVKNGLIATGYRCGRAKLKSQDIIKINGMYFSAENLNAKRLDMPFPITKIAKIFNVSPQAIYQIIKKRKTNV